MSDRLLVRFDPAWWSVWWSVSSIGLSSQSVFSSISPSARLVSLLNPPFQLQPDPGQRLLSVGSLACPPSLPSPSCDQESVVTGFDSRSTGRPAPPPHTRADAHG